MSSEFSAPDAGLSLVLSPEDPLLEVSLRTRAQGLVRFTRNDHRLSKTNAVKFAMDLVGHEADWRSGLGWMARRYAEFFNPPNPRAGEVAGLGAYSNWEGGLEVAKLHKMGFRLNWKASYDFPYMGMFLPPIPDAYFQRHLYLGAFPTAPLPDNDHTITPSPWADHWYLDYGPLFETLHGRKWVLQPHVVEVKDGAAKANLFEVSGGYVVPVVFGGQAAQVEVVVRGLRGRSKPSSCDALHPGVEEGAAIKWTFRHGELHLTAPLQRGCAILRVHLREPFQGETAR